MDTHGPITRDLILAYEALQERLHDRIDDIAPAQYAIEKGHGLNDRTDPRYRPPQYYLESWERSGEEIVARYEWSTQGGSEWETIRFPIAYLDDPTWEETLRAKLAEEAAQKAAVQAQAKAEAKARRKAAKALRAAEKQEQERAEYERLRAKFEQ